MFHVRFLWEQHLEQAWRNLLVLWEHTCHGRARIWGLRGCMLTNPPGWRNLKRVARHEKAEHRQRVDGIAHER